MIKRDVRVFSNNPHSAGAKALAQAIGVKRLKHDGSTWRGGAGKTVVCWGSGSALQVLPGTRIINPPEVVRRSSCKIRFLEAMGEACRVPEWTTDADVARGWVAEGVVVCARTTTTGHSAEGLVILENGVDFVQAPLYTKYVKKESEYRVHCFRRDFFQDHGEPGETTGIVDLQRKIKRPDFEGTPNWRIRNHSNGFVYVRNNVHPPEDVTRQALQAFEASGLDFGAVDVIFNAKSGLAYVLEINTAPGLAGATVQSYSRALAEALDLH